MCPLNSIRTYSYSNIIEDEIEVGTDGVPALKSTATGSLSSIKDTYYHKSAADEILGSVTVTFNGSLDKISKIDAAGAYDDIDILGDYILTLINSDEDGVITDMFDMDFDSIAGYAGGGIEYDDYGNIYKQSTRSWTKINGEFEGGYLIEEYYFDYDVLGNAGLIWKGSHNVETGEFAGWEIMTGGYSECEFDDSADAPSCEIIKTGVMNCGIQYDKWGNMISWRSITADGDVTVGTAVDAINNEDIIKNTLTVQVMPDDDIAAAKGNAEVTVEETLDSALTTVLERSARKVVEYDASGKTVLEMDYGWSWNDATSNADLATYAYIHNEYGDEENPNKRTTFNGKWDSASGTWKDTSMVVEEYIGWNALGGYDYKFSAEYINDAGTFSELKLITAGSDLESIEGSIEGVKEKLIESSYEVWDGFTAWGETASGTIYRFKGVVGSDMPLEADGITVDADGLNGVVGFLGNEYVTYSFNSGQERDGSVTSYYDVTGTEYQRVTIGSLSGNDVEVGGVVMGTGGNWIEYYTKTEYLTGVVYVDITETENSIINQFGETVGSVTITTLDTEDTSKELTKEVRTGGYEWDESAVITTDANGVITNDPEDLIMGAASTYMGYNKWGDLSGYCSSAIMKAVKA